MAQAPADPTIHELFDLTGKSAIVTGGTGHLGSALSSALAEAGASVVITSRDAAKAEQAAAALPVRGKAKHHGLALDQLDAAACERAFADAARRCGHIDVLVNNANHATGDDWTSVSADTFAQQQRNGVAYFILARTLHQHAVDSGRPASVVNIGSMYGVVGSYPEAYAGVTSASPVSYHFLKGGIIHMTRHLAVYWAGDGVRVNCLSPGPFPHDSVAPELVDRLNRKSPMRRMGRPHEVKGAVVFLASDASSYITGQNLLIDGGWTAW